MSLNVQSPLTEHHNNSFDFVKFYKPAPKNDLIEESTPHSPKRVPTPKAKGNKKGSADSADTDRVRETNNLDCQATSTPNASGSKIKSIMKNKQFDFSNGTAEDMPYAPKGKTKKRNKSVSFLIETGDETAIKKTKSQKETKIEKKIEKWKKKSKEPTADDKNVSGSKTDKKHPKKNDENRDSDLVLHNPKRMRSKIFRKTKVVAPDGNLELKNPESLDSIEKMNVEDNSENVEKPKKKHKNKNKQNQKIEFEVSEIIDGSTSSESQTNILKKNKTKRMMGSAVKVDGEPVTKSRKTDQNEDTIAEKIESLSIGDTPHSLTNLIDEMTVSDKNTRKTVRKQFKKEKRSRSMTSEVEPSQDSAIVTKEKVKWTRRKWNKGYKGDLNATSTVLVEKLSIALMLNYKQLLTDHFGQYGPIKKIGVAELYPSETLQPSFATTIQFFDEKTAMKALEDDNMLFHGAHVRVLRPLPPTMTTIVVRSFGELNDQSLSSVFASAGKIRSIKHKVKGRHTIGTSFVEFNGPSAVDKAIKIAETAKIGGKRLHVSKFEERSSKNAEDNTETE